MTTDLIEQSDNLARCCSCKEVLHPGILTYVGGIRLCPKCLKQSNIVFSFAITTEDISCVLNTARVQLWGKYNL